MISVVGKLGTQGIGSWRVVGNCKW